MHLCQALDRGLIAVVQENFDYVVKLYRKAMATGTTKLEEESSTKARTIIVIIY